ncbi:HAD-IIIC family phosphatase [Streptomyces niveiscabiei]|uniref:HAD-IIIC family phosphatase n=1 Tax=Streptomyces niveiscabiei TaxID=164115 RepID=UPI0029A65A70|nr:HAD-IIIC family phosphatase [Streptomyces niveiscabiei]MDX3383432.1 HAD-IIIC family phosphatase [Streptomyces niveiscabiei]
MTTYGHVKCVVWDLDGTLWDEVAVETPTDELPTPRPEMLAAIDTLTAHGVLSSIASRSAPTVLDRLAEHLPDVHARFLSPQVSWQDKSVALRRISEELGIATDSLLLVDDSPYERAEVAALLPGVTTLAPEELPLLLAEFEGKEVTPESRSRVDRYRTEAVRRAEGDRFEGTREEFLAWCDMRLTIGPATPADVPRALELAARTHRLNSSGLSPEKLRALVAGTGTHTLHTARMSDRFGDYGIIGAALVDHSAPDTWSVPLLALSCRVAGRGAAAAFLIHLMEKARGNGVHNFSVTLRPTDANLEMRLLLRQAGLRRTADTDATDGADGVALPVLTRSLAAPLPQPPSYLHVRKTPEA